MVAGKVNLSFHLSALTVLGNNEGFQTSTKLLQELHIFHVPLSGSAFLLLYPKASIHKLHLMSSLGVKLAWCKVLIMLFEIFVTLCNISELNSQFSASFSSLCWDSQVSYCECAPERSQNSQLLIDCFIWRVVGYVCFSASMAADWNSWTSGPQEVFEETCRILVRLIIFMLWIFVSRRFFCCCYWKQHSRQMHINVTLLCLISEWANVRVTLSVLLPLLKMLNIPVRFEEKE